MKQTAIDYLIEQMNIQGFFGVYCTEDKIDENRKLMTKIIEQAKEMEKEQSLRDYSHGVKDAITDINSVDCNRYYNETYGGNNENI